MYPLWTQMYNRFVCRIPTALQSSFLWMYSYEPLFKQCKITIPITVLIYHRFCHGARFQYLWCLFAFSFGCSKSTPSLVSLVGSLKFRLPTFDQMMIIITGKFLHQRKTFSNRKNSEQYRMPTRIKSSLIDWIRLSSILRHSTNFFVASLASTSLKPTLSNN